MDLFHYLSTSPADRTGLMFQSLPSSRNPHGASIESQSKLEDNLRSGKHADVKLVVTVDMKW